MFLVSFEEDKGRDNTLQSDNRSITLPLIGIGYESMQVYCSSRHGGGCIGQNRKTM